MTRSGFDDDIVAFGDGNISRECESPPKLSEFRTCGKNIVLGSRFNAC